MRNLKKVLSLSLALVMLLGLMVVGAGAATTFADLKDKDEISENYAEAVDLLTALGVLEGNENDEFMPTGTLTREAAAKIVAYLALGVDAAEKLSVTSAPFKDVAANRWSAGYIAYCANVGIIDGDGKGSFYPTQTVTGYQFAKMLLGVLGYGAKDEYVGTNWALNVATDGVTVGLFDRLSNVGNTPATREEAAQLAFNALNTNMVTFSELYGTYSAYIFQYGNQTLLGTKADKIFDVETYDFADDYGYNYHYWKYQNSKAAITDNYLSDTILGTVTSGTAGALEKEYDLDDRIEVYENGVYMKANNYYLGEFNMGDFGSYEDRNGDTHYGFDASFRGSNAKVTPYNGQTITVVDQDNDGDADKLIVVTSYLAKVTKVTAATASADRSVTVTVYAPTKDGKTFTTTFETEDYEKDDYILVDPQRALQEKVDTTEPIVNTNGSALNNTMIIGSQAAEVVSGATVTAYYLNTGSKANGSVTTGGVKYNYNGVFAGYDETKDYLTAGAGTVGALGNEYTTATNPYYLNSGSYNLYLDQNGNVIGVEVVENAIRDFAYIIAVGEDSFKNNNIVNVVLSDGTVGVYTVSSRSSASAYDDGTGSDAYCQKGDVYAYSLDGDTITLTDLQDNVKDAYSSVERVTTVANAYTKGESTFVYNNSGSKVAYATDETVFIYKDGTKITRFVGKENAPDLDKSGVQISMALRTSGRTDYIEYVVINDAPKATMSTNYVYITSGVVGYSEDVNGNDVYYYNVVKDGVATTIAIDKNGLGLGVYLYSVNMDLFTSDDPNKVENGEYTVEKATASNGVIENFQIDVISSGNVIVDEKAYTTTTDNVDVLLGEARVIDLTANPIDTEATLSVTDTVVIVYETAGNLKIAKDIYIVDRYEAMEVADLEDATADAIAADTYVNGSVTLGAALTVNTDQILYIDGNLITNGQTVTVNGTLIVSGTVTGAVNVGAAGTLVVKESATFAPDTVLASSTNAGATVVLMQDVTTSGSTVKFYDNNGADESADSAGDGTASTELTTGNLVAGSYVYGIIYTDVNGTTGNGWVQA